MPDILLAVDTNFVMDLASASDVSFDALDVIRRRLRGAQVSATSTVIDELFHKAQNDPDFRRRTLASKALSGMTTWDVFPVVLPGPQSLIARNIANKLLEQGIILRKERNDARILAEAAVLGCQLLLTSDVDFRNTDSTRLKILLGEFGFATVPIRKPKEIVREFGGR